MRLSYLGMVQQVPDLINNTTFPLPEGLSHETLDPMLLAECAELEILYPEPIVLGAVIKAWATSRGPAWERMMAALDAEYSPIENYDRSETWTDTRNLADNHSGQTATQSTGQTAGSGSDTETVAGFNETSFTNKGKHELSSAESSNSNVSASTSVADTHTGTVSRTSRTHGNIGVTTAQAMVEAEVSLRRMDIYQIIINEFRQRFCLLIY